MTIADVTGTMQSAPARLSSGPRAFSSSHLEKENALQAEASALVPELDHAEPLELQRLGETVEFGSLLLRIPALNGWTIDKRPALGGVLVTAMRNGHVVSHWGPTVADVALPIFEAVAALQERSGPG